MNKKLFLFACLFLCSIHLMLAQTQTVSGNIVDAENGMPLPGVNVIEKGTSNGVSSDFDGMFSIEIDEGSILQFSMLGYVTQEIKPDGSEIQVELAPDTEALDEVVVTALGIKREKKSLGYALQEVGGESLTQARENNLANAMTGKVAGLQVVRGSGGPASSSKIVLRGNNSLTGDNQPLIVVDGVPMDNFTGAANNDYWNPSPDMGNGLGDLNPENIESMSVLKGASAAALYGSRAGNGVILITTKTGKKQEGLGVSYSTNIGFQSIFSSPELQDSYGQGSNGQYDNQSGSSWGPKIEGQTVENAEGEQEQLRAYDNLDNYFDNGLNVNHSLSLQQQVTDGTSLFSSVNHLDDESLIPGASLERLNLMTRGVSVFGKDDKWKSDVKVQYIRATAQNRPLNGVNISNAFATMYLLPRSLDVTRYERATDEFGNMRWYVPTNSMNPYWAARNNLNMDTRDRFMLNGSIRHDFNDWLYAEVKAGADLYTTNTESKLYSGSPLSATGRFSVGKNTFRETNYNAIISATKDDIFGKWGGSVTLGGNLMEQESSSISGNAGELEVPNLFALNNGIGNPGISESYSNKKINSAFGTFQINYDGFLFVDVTGRNDWSSTLSADNRSFFYPSVSTSLVVTDMIKNTGGNVPDWINFAKVRGSYAEVGNDLPAYQLYNFYNIGKDPNGNTTAGRNGTLYNPDVKSELIRSTEFGLDARFFNNRFGVDFSYYKTNATRQLINLPLNPLSGYSSVKVNAGDIENKGFELMLNGRLLDNPEGLNWDMNLNFSRNVNTVVELADGVTQYSLGGFDNLAILAVEGEPYGEIYGTKYQRVEDESSPFFGEIIVDGDGIPLATSEKERLGNQQPDFLLGFSNSFSYKNFSLSFLLDARIGGEIYSGTNRAIQNAGTGAETVTNGNRDNIVVDGVVADENGGFAENTTEVSPQLYWQNITERSGNLGINEANIYDATNFRLRSINLRYDLPTTWLDNTFFNSAYAGLSANNVWMIDSNLNGVDPESVYATGTNAVGFENLASPTISTVFLNIGVKF
ncbi:TonB-linked outer membrane protein, SusC/RagA family [Salegentibacter holothuriorum]|uniref:TonB-linked outer membrane protein, SusC/RagA family n=1 Tax=Salegentibacter holothuriorum TaxID=241145 RepID=A0A1T5DHW6_9FLAO|nr:SusC/RagA family TonB-linked outer membrane protein [Salegentibacter holothuriorum]SKB71171.1 TonB-linked outer membrane protein, SusC/RagA family [Salegentibacter holothuriorum]